MKTTDDIWLFLYIAAFFACSVESTVYKVRVQQEPTIPQPKYSFQEAVCQFSAKDSNENSSELSFCEKNIDILFSDIIDLSTENEVLNLCSFQLNCEEKLCPSDKIGQLCKTCRGNLSSVLGGPGCRQCNNFYLLLIIPFAVIGILIVFLILKCNLTVSNGRINSLLFYANVLHVYRQIQFTEFGSEVPFFSIFISWLNLDLGIETCFYDGMDAYSKTWLQFVFPAYLWFLIFVLLILTKIFPKINRFLDGNAIPSLTTTVIILTYSKITLSVQSALSFEWNKNDTFDSSTIWFEDDTVTYFGSRHTYLFTFAVIVALLYLLPLTLLGLFAPCLESYLRRNKFKTCVKRAKPWLSAYQAPYNPKFQHWTGLMILFRAIINILLGVTKLEDSSLAYFLLVTIIGPLAIYVTVKTNKTVYRRKFSNSLEAISLLNLTLLNLLSWFLTTTKYTRAIALKQYVTYVSITITMVLFFLVLFYQFSLVLCPQICFIGRRNSTRNYLVPESTSESESDSEVVITTSSFTVQEIPKPEPENQQLLRAPLLEQPNQFAFPTVRTFANDIASQST